MCARKVDYIHESVVRVLLEHLDVRSKARALCVNRDWRRLLSSRDLWTTLDFDQPISIRTLDGETCIKLLARSCGVAERLQFASGEALQKAQDHKRFVAGVKRWETMPYTRGLRAIALASVCKNLSTLIIDERTSCLGGMTDEFARALAAQNSALQRLDVIFEPYSQASELLTDDGMIALLRKLSRLQTLRLIDCDNISNRSLYAAAAYCPNLTSVTISGYNERITDAGLSVLLRKASNLNELCLSSKLVHVTDDTLHVAAECTAGLSKLQVTASMTVAALLQVLPELSQLQYLDMSALEASAEQVLQIAAAAPHLQQLVLHGGAVLPAKAADLQYLSKVCNLGFDRALSLRQQECAMTA